MRGRPKSRSWLLRLGWTPYLQTTRNQRQAAPSIVLIRGPRIVLAYLRTSKRNDRRPPLDAVGQMTGAEVVHWAPADRSTIKRVLL
jgi:hypothetical protein